MNRLNRDALEKRISETDLFPTAALFPGSLGRGIIRGAMGDLGEGIIEAMISQQQTPPESHLASS